MSGELKTCTDVFTCKIGEIGEDVRFAHAGSQVFQYIIHRDAQSSDTRFPAPLSRINCDAILVRHEMKRTPEVHKDQGTDERPSGLGFR